MNGLLVRLGADQSSGGGNWNAPVDLASRRFVYVPIPETKPSLAGLETPYAALAPVLASFNLTLPVHLAGTLMHLDPDFRYGTYGDRGSKGRQIAENIVSGDLLIFYAGLRDIASGALVYAIVGLFVIDDIIRAGAQPSSEFHRNAHTRRVLANEADDIIVVASEHVSGRLTRCIPIGDFRARAYRVRKDLLEQWGGVSANDGYLQRSAVFPRLRDAAMFWHWWKRQEPTLVRANNLEPPPALGTVAKA